MSRQMKRLSHSVYECKYHIVFCPKYRYRIFKDGVGEYTKQEIYRLSQQKDQVEVLEVNVQPDHVHLVVSIPPKYAVSEFMGYLKGKSALMIFDRHSNLKYKYGNRHFWSRGYYVSTVGLNEATIAKYVREQEKHDQMMDRITTKEAEDPFRGS